MLKKKYFAYLLAIALLLAGSIGALAQGTAITRGRVEMTKDGKKVPVVEATVDAYRMDGSGKLSAKTNKRGEFSYAGLMLGQVYVLAVSGPGISPMVYPKVKAGMESIVIDVAEGDGKVLTEQEAKTAAGQALPAADAGGLTAAQKKEQEELLKKNQEIEEKNKRTQAGDEIARKSFEDGKKFIAEKNFDAAITALDAGITAVPDYVGSTTVLLTLKMISLKERALKTFKEGSAAGTDVSVKLSKIEAAKKDFNEALASFDRAMAIVKDAPADPSAQKQRDSMKADLYTHVLDTHRLMARTQVDVTKGKEAQTVFAEYFAFETDAAKKAKQTMVLADILRNDGDCDAAAVEYKKILATTPEDPDALAGAGLCMFSTGIAANDKAIMQEGLNMMEHFAAVAPDTHELKASVKDAVEYLKTEQNLKAQKPATTPKRKN